MKKFISIVLAVAMLAALGCVAFAVSAEEPATFLVTHYNDGSVEGAGVIFTTEDTAGAWWIHVAFAPVEGLTNVYEIVEYVNGSDGSGVALAIPEGGFVWAANTGNNWPELIANAKGDEWFYDDTHKAYPNFTNDTCNANMAMAGTWAVGDQFVIEGVDFETIPTSTPDKNWYEEGYVCTATIAPYVEGSDAPESSEEAPESSEEAPESSEEAPSEPEVDLKAEYTDSIATLVGEATEDTSFDIVLDSTADAEGVVTVTMTIDNIADGAALTGLYAYLYYDAERMTLTTTANSEGALECLTKLPCDEWAEDNVICAKDGYIDIGIGVTKDPMTAISADAPIVLTFTFQMNEGFEYAGVYATTADASASDKDFNDYYGNGAYEIAELPAEVVDPSEDVSSDETPVPGTGDAGIVVFAVLAIVAICGAAVVVKVRG